MTVVAAVLVAALFGAQFKLRSLDFRMRRRVILGWWMAGGAMIALLNIRASWLQWLDWKAGALSRLFLPPYQSPLYFLQYVASRFWLPWFAALLAAFLGICLTRYLNRRAGERFFHPEEPLLFGAALFFAGYPGLLFYCLLLGVAAVFLTLAYQLSGRGRAPLYFVWLPAALFAILITYELPPDILARFNF